MKTAKILSVLTVFLLILSLAACGTDKDGKEIKGSEQVTEGSNDEITALLAMEPSTDDEAADLHQKLMAQENAILSENSALWEKVTFPARPQALSCLGTRCLRAMLYFSTRV